MTIWFATGNLHKKKELADILSADINLKTPWELKVPWELKTPKEAGLEFDPEETGKTFLENALIKASALYQLVKEPVIADDSGICVDALDGNPGVYSARYGGKGLSTAERNALLLSEYDNLEFAADGRKARFVCAMVLYYSPDRFFVAQETLEGELVKNIDDARGTDGFGYDPILFIPEMGRTVAELTDVEKSRLSHRGKAGRVIAKILAENKC